MAGMWTSRDWVGSRFGRFAALVPALFLVVQTTACGDDDENADGADGGTSGTGAEADDDGEAGEAGETTADPTTGDGEGEGTQTGGDDTTDSAGSTDGGIEPQPDGSSCSSDDECESGHCYTIGALGGFCGECSSDADCEEGGCSVPNPLATPPQGSTCNMGELGGGCEDDSVCQEGLTCEVVIDATGIATISTCSECETDDDCTEGDATLCSPTIDVFNVTGENSCVTPGSVADGEACNFDGNGAEACNSGFCKEVTVMSVITFGVCGECALDTDCADGEVCSDPEISLENQEITPPTCGAPA